MGGEEDMRWTLLGVGGLESGEGESYGRIMSGLVSVGDGRPEGMWEVDSCMAKNRAFLGFAESCAADGDPSVSMLRMRKRKCGVVIF